MTIAAPVPRSISLRTWRDRNPQWWVTVVAGVGWAVLIAMQFSGYASAGPESAGHMDHVHHGAGPASGAWGAVPMIAVHWIAMIAVMLPLSWASLCYAGRRSPARARLGNTLSIGLGWFASWVLGAVVLVALSMALGTIGPLGAAAVGVGLGLLWLALPLRRRSLARCHRRYAPPLRQPSAACRAFGMRLGRDCAISCGPMMLVMAVTGHHVTAAVAMVALGWFERRRPHHDPSRVIPAIVLVTTAAVSLAQTGTVP